ncbi:uncharacterized protein LOC141586539 [Silene latifolia]|uniref:uncharacterized protein LOC141586539 n=1 Tax=Silene latifolia TaxID=37657 RepID=UPI003D76ABF5
MAPKKRVRKGDLALQQAELVAAAVSDMSPDRAFPDLHLSSVTMKVFEAEMEESEQERQFDRLSMKIGGRDAERSSQPLLGFVKRVWQANGVDKVAFLPNGLFLVRFKTKAQQQSVLSNGHLLFDNKPIIIKEWTPDMELVKHEVTRVPIWMKIFGLDVKYWGGESLRKLSGGVGKFIKCDDPTLHKQFLGFARIMVEVDVDQQFPSVVEFLDENGKNQSVRIEYDWLPVSCTACKGVGHTAEKCRKGVEKQPVTKKVWKPRNNDPKLKEPAKQPP